MNIGLTAVSQKRTIILLGAGFDACLAVSSIKQLREAGIAVQIVGQTAGSVRDVNGISMNADISLSNLASSPENKLLIFPGGKAYASTLLTDPRVHNLIDSIISNKGFLLVSEGVQGLIEVMGGKGALFSACFMFRENSGAGVVAPELIDLFV